MCLIPCIYRRFFGSFEGEKKGEGAARGEPPLHSTTVRRLAQPLGSSRAGGEGGTATRPPNGPGLQSPSAVRVDGRVGDAEHGPGRTRPLEDDLIVQSDLDRDEVRIRGNVPVEGRLDQLPLRRVEVRVRLVVGVEGLGRRQPVPQVRLRRPVLGATPQPQEGGDGDGDQDGDDEDDHHEFDERESLVVLHLGAKSLQHSKITSSRWLKRSIGSGIGRGAWSVEHSEGIGDHSSHPPRMTTGAPPVWGTPVDRRPTAYWISSKILKVGRYSAITMAPTAPPTTAIITGSISEVRDSTAAVTSSS